MTERALDRTHWTLAAAAALLLASWPASSHAQEGPCMEDADCATGFRCDLPEGEVCTDRDGETPECAPALEGECEPEPIACDEDPDCPIGLRCETARTVEECGVTPAQPRGAGDGEPEESEPEDSCTSEEVPLDEPRCVLELVSCEEDDECDAGFSCQGVGRVEECSSDVPKCEPGGNCQPSEPVCTETRVDYYCFPIRSDCDADADCEDGWRCGELPEDARDNPPPGWEDAGRVCLPEGYLLAFEGRVPAGRNSGSDSDGASRDGLAEDGASGDDDAEDVSGDQADASSSCSVHAAGRGRGASGTPAALLLALALLHLRRAPDRLRRTAGGRDGRPR